MKQIKLKYVPTGIIFTLPEDEALKIYKEAKGIDYKILNKDFVEEEPKKEETTVYQQVVEEEPKKKTKKGK